MQDRLKQATSGPKKARKRRSDAKSFAQVKSDIDIADAAKRAKKIGEYSPEYEDDLSDEQRRKFKKEVIKSKEEKQEQEKAYQKDLAKARSKGGRTALPQATTKTPQGQPQKGQTDQEKAAQEFNARKNLERRLDRERAADSGANRFPQEPFPEVDPSKRPKSDIPFSQFQKNQRLAQNKKDAEAAAEYRKTSEYALQTGQVDPDTKELLSKDELKRRFKLGRSQKKDDPNVQALKQYRNRRKQTSDVELYSSGGFKSGKEGTLTRRGTKPESPNVETMPEKIGRKMKTMADKTQTGQMSYLGALGGLITKGVSSSAAGAEAGMRFARGDKGGAALSALQGLGGGVGFAAGVANAIRSVRMAKGVPDQKIFGRKFDKKFFDTDKKNRQLAKAVSPEDLGMAAAAGGAVIPQVKGVLDKLRSQGLPTAKGGRAGTRRARGGGGL